MEKGNLSVLFQPAELVIIFGASIGGFLIATPFKQVKLVLNNLANIFKGQHLNRLAFIELLSLLYTIFIKIRKDGLISIESDIEKPSGSPIFKKYKTVLSNPKGLDFICDNLRVIITTNMPPHELDNLLDIDIEANNHEAMAPSLSLEKIADALPGLGIVAAVLGVVLTMSHINEPPEILGHLIGAALVGTFLGVLACYGFVGPMSQNLSHKAMEALVFYNVVKVTLVSFVGGSAPQIAVESGRRAIPSMERPGFLELEKAIRKK